MTLDERIKKIMQQQNPRPLPEGIRRIQAERRRPEATPREGRPRYDPGTTVRFEDGSQIGTGLQAREHVPQNMMMHPMTEADSEAMARFNQRERPQPQFDPSQWRSHWEPTIGNYERQDTTEPAGASPLSGFNLTPRWR